MVKNLRNVAIPGTGVPLSVFCYFKITAYWFLLCLTPCVCLVAALKSALTPANLGGSALQGSVLCKVASEFSTQLLCPQDWFSYWRLNCRLATWHSSVCPEQDKRGYALEDKWLFLETAEAKGVPVSPSLRLPGIVVKHRNEEGGMGFQSFRNAVHGGDWCIQARLANSPFLNSLLPANCFYVIIVVERGKA